MALCSIYRTHLGWQPSGIRCAYGQAMNSIRRHLSYANVVATLALVFAMSGGALAAKHYLISSTKQISPKVLKALEAKLLAKVRAGAAGPQGVRGQEGAPGQEGKEGAKGGEGLSLLSHSEQELLERMIAHVKFLPVGVGGAPTLQFSGVNVQIVNGEGETATTNGAGNLVIGYDEQSGKTQTGSHDVILGEEQQYTTFGGIVAGSGNTISGPGASVTGGSGNIASGQLASVTGGEQNEAQGFASSVTGGSSNRASNYHGAHAASVSGGAFNVAFNEDATVSGGSHNSAEEVNTWVGGGLENQAGDANPFATAKGENSAISGGLKNTTLGNASSIFGGKELTAKNDYEALP
jgi:hypothetical protein